MAIVDTAVILLTSLLVGSAGVFVGVRLIVDDTVSVESAVLTALTGAATWGAISSVTGLVPVVGPLSALVVWITVIELRYPRGWGTAASLGFVAWLAVVAVLYALGTQGLVSLSEVGVPEVGP